MKKSKRLVVLACMLFLAGLAGAMVSTNYNLSWHVIGGGGGPMSSTNYRMAGTVGQITGVSESTNYRLEAGYWSGIAFTPTPMPTPTTTPSPSPSPSPSPTPTPTPTPPSVPVFDTGSSSNPYPAISGTHNGTITSTHTVNVNKIFIYPCADTGGHIKYARIWNSSWDGAEARWGGYVGDWHNLPFDKNFTLVAGEPYNYTIRTGSYPQIIHETSWNATGGMITCEEFVDVNGKRHEGWIPAARLY